MNHVVSWCILVKNKMMLFRPHCWVVKKKGSFYIAQYPVRWTAQSALHFLPSLTDLFIPTPFSANSCRDPEGAMKNLSHFGHLRLAGTVYDVSLHNLWLQYAEIRDGAGSRGPVPSDGVTLIGFDTLLQVSPVVETLYFLTHVQ